MKISELLVERRIQRTITMYHGTSTKHVPAILKHGLLANPPAATYSSDNDEGDPAYNTFKGGVYVTNNKNIALKGAINATEAAGGRPVLVTLQYVLGSGQVDEDDIYMIMGQTFISSVPSKVETVSDAAVYFSKKENVGKTIVDAIENFNDHSQLNFDQYDFAPGKLIMKRGVESYIKKLCLLFINEINKGANDNSEYKGFIEFTVLNQLRYNPEYENTIYQLLASIKPKESTTLRIPRDIKFAGKTRILDIRNMETNEVYYTST